MGLLSFTLPRPHFFITMNMLKKGMAFLAARQAAAASEQILYKMPDRAIGPFPAVLANTEIVEDGENGSSHTIRAADFIFPVNLLSRKPQPGDLILYGRETYEVRRDSIGGGWRYADPYQTRYRVHTQIV